MLEADCAIESEQGKKMKSAIVTGSSRGIGAAVLKRLAEDGFGVVVNYIGGHEEADAVAAEVRAAGGQAITVKADVSLEADVKRLFDETKSAFRTVDVVVHNAGIMPLSPLANDEPVCHFHLRSIIRVRSSNGKGVECCRSYRVCRHARARRRICKGRR